MFSIIKFLGIGPYIAAAILIIFGLVYGSITADYRDFGYMWLGVLICLVQTLLIAIIIGAALIFDDDGKPAMKHMPSQEKDVQQNEDGGKE